MSLLMEKKLREAEGDSVGLRNIYYLGTDSVTLANIKSQCTSQPPTSTRWSAKSDPDSLLL